MGHGGQKRRGHWTLMPSPPTSATVPIHPNIPTATKIHSNQPPPSAPLVTALSSGTITLTEFIAPPLMPYNRRSPILPPQPPLPIEEKTGNTI